MLIQAPVTPALPSGVGLSGRHTKWLAGYAGASRRLCAMPQAVTSIPLFRLMRIHDHLGRPRRSSTLCLAWLSCLRHQPKQTGPPLRWENCRAIRFSVLISRTTEKRKRNALVSIFARFLP